MSIYLDASIVVPLVVNEPSSENTRDWIDIRLDALHVGHLAVGEAGSAISRRRRMKLLTDSEGDRALDAMDTWLQTAVTLIQHDPDDIARASRMVRTPLPKLLMGDAIHIATCQRLGLTLATYDADLANIAAREGVSVERP